MVLVDLALESSRDEALEDARGVPGGQRVGTGVPIVEVTDDRDSFGVRGPHREVAALHPLDHTRVGSQVIENTKMAALVEEVDVVGAPAGVGHD